MVVPYLTFGFGGAVLYCFPFGSHWYQFRYYLHDL